MKKVISTILLLCFGILGFAQTDSIEIDTITLESCLVQRPIPVNDETMALEHGFSTTNSIDDITNRLANMSVISRGAFAMEPVIHSFSSGQINVVIDDMKMFGACTDKMDPITSYIETNNLESVELTSGTSGSKYGSTFGGTYNMHLQSADTSVTRIQIGGGYKSNERANFQEVMYNYGAQKWAFRVNAVQKKFNEYYDGNNEIVPFTQFRKSNVHSSFILYPNKKSHIKADYLYDKALDVGYPALPMDVGLAQAQIGTIEYITQDYLKPLFYIKYKAYYNTIYHLMDDSMRDSLYMVTNKKTLTTDSVFMKMDMPGWSSTLGAFVEGRIKISRKNFIETKIEGYSNTAKAEMTMYMNNLSNPGEPPMYAETWPETRRSVYGVYVNDKHSFSKKIAIQNSLRVDYNSSTLLSDIGKQELSIITSDIQQTYSKMTLTYNAIGSLLISKSTKLNTGFGYGERMPTLSEQFGFYLFNAYDGYDYIGNPDLRKEKSTSVWFALEHISKEFKISTEAHANFIRDYIFGTTHPELGQLNLYAQGLKKYENIEFAKVYSLSLQSMYMFSKDIHWYSQVSYNYGVTVNNKALPTIAPLESTQTFRYIKSKIQILFEIELAAAQNRVDNSFGEQKSEGYAIYNLRCVYTETIKKHTIKLSGGIENITSEVYSRHLDWGNYYRPGRNFTIHATYSL